VPTKSLLLFWSDNSVRWFTPRLRSRLSSKNSNISEIGNASLPHPISRFAQARPIPAFHSFASFFGDKIHSQRKLPETSLNHPSVSPYRYRCCPTARGCCLESCCRAVMPVSLTLKRRGAYTNLDWIEGDVKLDLSSSESIDNIVVKVEGNHIRLHVNNIRNK